MTIRKKYDDFLIFMILFWASLITVLRSLRWPNDFAEAHWLISYNFGFIKRGLPGTILLPFVNENAELVIKIVSASIYGLFCALLLWVCLRMIKNSKNIIGSILAALLFLTSPYMVMSAHLNGYFDDILIIISVMSCMLVAKEKIALSSFVISIGVLIHETIFVVGFPSVLFFSLLQHVRQVNPSRTTQIFLGFFSRFRLLIFMPVFVFLCVIIHQTFFLNPEVLKSQIVTHLSQFEFIEVNRRSQLADGFTYSFFAYLFEQRPYFFQRITNPVYLYQIGLPIFILLIFGFRKLQVLGSRWLLFIVFAVVTLLPLTLHFVAWDTSRIWAYPIVISLLGIWAITETHAGIYSDKEYSLLFNILIFICIVFELFVRTHLMDGEHELFSAAERLLLYAPSLILLAVYIKVRSR